MKLPQNNLNYPLRITIGNSLGSGFFLEKEGTVYLVTAKHVLFRTDPVSKENTLINEVAEIGGHTLDGTTSHPFSFQVGLGVLLSDKNLRLHPSADLAVFKFGIYKEDGRIHSVRGIKIEGTPAGSVVHYPFAQARRFKDVEVSNEVFVLGYPASLSTQEMDQLDYGSPLVRRGVVAGKNNRNNTVILDCPVYGGNSGGIVLEINSEELKIHLIGVVTQFIPFVDQWRSARFSELVDTQIENSGYSVALPVDYIETLFDDGGEAKT